MFHFPGRDCCIKRQSKLMCNVRSMKRIFCGSTPTSEYTKVSNKGLKNQNTRMAQSESGHVASKDSKTRSDACSGQQSAVPLAVVEEILLNLPAHQVVQVCRLVCHEWKELVDSAAHWRVRCRREGLQPNDASRPPEDWCQFYFLSKFRRNLLKNPRADDGLQGWEIVQNGADNWATELNRIPLPDNTVTKCFVTSNSQCFKEQLIDLKKEGYSEAFMDQLRPHIKISDWYASCHDCGSEYQICVELLDQRKNSIKTFQPEKVILSFWNGEPWCEMSHVFKNYGPGVRFIRFTHGGNDTQFWAGHYGIRVTNSSVVIYPADESFRLTNRNLLKNPSAQEGLQGWEIVEDGGDCWVTGGNGTTFPVNTCFVTSYGLCLKEQTIDLKEEGYSDALMDQQQPHIKISDWYTPLSDYGSQYQLSVYLLDQEKNPIRTYHPYKIFFQSGNDYPWCQISYVFRNYRPGVRFIRFTHGGGWSGIRITNSSVEICPAAERLRCTKPNLLRNPSAQDGLRGWKIVGSGRDCWVIGENRKPIPDLVTSCFVTSYGLCLKRQLIDLNKEGYSDTFMDQVQPHIKISDWYSQRYDCGSEYQICVELLDQRKNPIKTFQPEKVILSFGNSVKWYEMSHVFKNYGPGVRFIRFTHGGNDTQFWAGHYGIRVTNSSVVIYPADESFRLTNRNLLKNSSAQEGLQGWEIVEDGGDRWVTGGSGTTFPVNTCFVTSYGLCLKEQLIDLKEEGYSDALMDQQQPHIKISDWYAPLSDCGSEYQICVELLDEKKKPISTFQPEKVFFQQGTIYPWRQMFHVFRNYGPGVRFIRFTHGGKDTKFQEGQHGIKVTNSSVEIYLTD
ncbi:uncharacterized protein fbxo44.9 isoform X2 [Carassius gibelio]|uniref:uncharacterized protein fbxo44.9 isoform X2 n=1 Tax=Carassius gibelio TaxID=101364 RepID=UPI0022793EAB|nr:uncharacterized protein fbxo44.9 isoform X2 [Carassius gibelio]